ncbi:MAG: VPLPA-CTERM sorting domain-containing protein [Planctomycetota bacterium]
MISHACLRPFGRLSLVAAFAVSCSFSHAGIINYDGPNPGPGGALGWLGANVWYGEVSESNTEGTGGSDGQTAELFGAPTGITGNAIDLDPQSFEASSTDGGFDITDGQFNFVVMGMGGSIIDSLTILERGDTTLGGIPINDNTFTTVVANVFIDVIEVDGAPVTTTTNLPTQQLVFTPSGGDYKLLEDGGGAPFFTTDWDGAGTFDIGALTAAELSKRGETFERGATKIRVALNNILTANSVDGTSSIIKKKDGDISVITEIPEPASAGLLFAGLVAAGCLRRRR